MGIKTLKTFNKDFVLTKTGETIGGLETLTGSEALAQVIQNRLKLWVGEWFYKPLSGFDWLGLLNQKTFLEQRARLMVRNAILEDERILRINKLEVSFNNSTRKMTINWAAQSSAGLIAGTVIQ